MQQMLHHQRLAAGSGRPAVAAPCQLSSKLTRCPRSYRAHEQRPLAELRAEQNQSSVSTEQLAASAPSQQQGTGELSALHAELLKEIEERKRSQAQLLAKLNRLTEQQVNPQPSPASWQQPRQQPQQQQNGQQPQQQQSLPPLAPWQQQSQQQPPLQASQSATAAGTRPGYVAPPYMRAPTTAPPSTQPVTRPSTPYTQPVTRTPPPVTQPPPSRPPPELEVYVEPDVPPTEPIADPPPTVAEQPPAAGVNVMKVVMVGAECAPWSKTGGLGDVMAALPKALRRRGHRTMCIAPRYDNYPDAWETGVRVKFNCFGSEVEVGYFHAFVDGVDYVFVDHPCFHSRGKDIYGGSRLDALFRCSLLSKAALEAVWHVPCGGVTYGDDNLVFIANDWHTALLPVYLQAHYRDYGQMTYARAMFVIHNMAHQGRGPMVEVQNLELSDHYKEMFRLYDPVGGEHMNVMKAGLQLAHRLVAVSHGYAWECLTPEGGWGLHAILGEAKWKLRGIVNGIDVQEWNPKVDTFLKEDGYTTYTRETFQQGKRKCKMALQKELGLTVDPNIPLLGFIGRLDYQKGVDLIRDNYDWLMSEKVQLVMLGSGREDLEQALRDMENSNKAQCRGWVGFSVKMAHRITAGCDILLMPSRFEPCGLNQLYAMAYGTVPVVHAVGGLRDTVQQFNPFENTGTGWVFDRAEAPKLRDAVGNALYTYRQFRESFTAIALRGMDQDLSWDNAASQYEEVMVAAKYQW